MKEFRDNYIRTKELDPIEFKELFKEFKQCPSRISYTYSKERRFCNNKGIYDFIRECIPIVIEHFKVFSKYKKISKITIPIVELHSYYEIELNISMNERYICNIEINVYDNDSIVFRVIIGDLLCYKIMV